MAALTADRDTPRRDGGEYALPVTAGAVCYAGGIAFFVDGAVRPAADDDDLTGRCVGIFTETVNNSDGDDGDVSVTVRPGVFRFGNAPLTVDKITDAMIGTYARVMDDQTVGIAADDSTHAGIIVAVDAAGVWVAMGATIPVQGGAGMYSLPPAT